MVTLAADVGSPVQVLVTNEGVASGLLTLSCRADLPIPKPSPKALSKPLPRVDLNPIADPATGAQGPVEALPEPPGPKPAGVKEDVSQEPSTQDPTAQEPAVQEPSVAPEAETGLRR